MITNLKQINATTEEGRLLVAAIGKLHAKCCQDKTPEEILLNLNELADKIFDVNTAGRMNETRRPADR